MNINNWMIINFISKVFGTTMISNGEQNNKYQEMYWTYNNSNGTTHMNSIWNGETMMDIFFNTTTSLGGQWNGTIQIL